MTKTPKMEEIEHVKKPSDDDDRSSKCDKVTIKMISPAQATLERAKSEIRPRKKRRRAPANDLTSENGKLLGKLGTRKTRN